jgi:hypothetical protein
MTSYSLYIVAVLLALLVAACGTSAVPPAANFCDLYPYDHAYSEATKDFWRTTEDPGAQADRLVTAQTRKVYRCLCPDDHNNGTEDCPE